MLRNRIAIPAAREFRYICYARVDPALVKKYPNDPLKWIIKVGTTTLNLLSREQMEPLKNYKGSFIVEICRFRDDTEE
jgi:hypothetical protein